MRKPEAARRAWQIAADLLRQYLSRDGAINGVGELNQSRMEEAILDVAHYCDQKAQGNKWIGKRKPTA